MFFRLPVTVIVFMMGLVASHSYAVSEPGVIAASARADSEKTRIQRVLKLSFEDHDSPFINSGFAGGNNATCAGGACPTRAAGLFGMARDFDGTDDVVTVADHAAINFTADEDFTLSWYVYLFTLASQETFVDKSDGTIGYFAWMADGSAAQLECGRGGFKNDGVEAGADHLVANHWHHLVCVFDGTADTVTLYDDGRQLVSGGLTTDTATVAQPLTLGDTNGADAGGSTFGNLDGIMDEFYIYNAQVSRAQIKQMYLQGVWRLRWQRIFEDFQSGVHQGRGYYLSSWSWLPMLLG